MYFIREADQDDINGMLEHGLAMHEESGYGTIPVNAEKMKDMIASCVWRDEGIALVAMKDGEMVAGFIGEVYASYFTDHMFSSDHALFIHPDHRGGTLAMRMIKKYISTAKEKGAQHITIGTTTGVNTEAIGRLYQRLGFTYVGMNFRMDV